MHEPFFKMVQRGQIIYFTQWIILSLWYYPKVLMEVNPISFTYLTFDMSNISRTTFADLSVGLHWSIIYNEREKSSYHK